MSDYVPRETLINILTRLPAKTLLRFRCICKSWLSLLSSPDFTSAHLRTAAAKPPVLLLRGYSLTGLTPRYKELYSLRSDDADFTSLLDLHCPFKTRAVNFFRVVGSCNGLICLSDDLLGYTYTVILWNPAIRRNLTLPMPNICFEDYGPYMFSLGFGFDPKTNDHKVVRIVYLEGSGRVKGWVVPPKVEVYALSTGVWKTIKGSKIGYHMVEVFWSRAFANCGVHWTAYSGGKSTGYCNVVLVFDMGSEVFREVKLPEKLVGASPLDLAVTVWVMKEYGVEESWSRLFTGSLNGDVSTVLGFRKSGEVVVEKWDGTLVSCQPGKIKKMRIRGGKESFYLGTYAESLILLDEGKCVQMDDNGSSDEVDSAGNAFVVRSLEKNSLRHHLFAATALNP
ncbi:hypothetical protein RHMOL_Rhmol10G0079700 [Rhododendron molle]|uniref:Uncharacterized protein n=1 Tax=Rhododendron molle TaxID=49168 RepID=A0ACC0M136_RHOML|nr:hypothetical protein RHMOL_Rhmol10G0079700 [Rhododendron molle]